MRIALKIAYDGRAFFGHQRQPDRRTVEGECLAALKAARILKDPREAFFRSASRTDRGVSALGNVIAFNTDFPVEGIVGAFDDKARDVWAWSWASVPDSFHPRHAVDRWYRYTILEDVPEPALREGARLFTGTHDFQSFCSEPLRGPLTVDSVGVVRDGDATYVDVRARSFRRGMVRRIVAALLAISRDEATLEEVRRALGGTRRDFGSMPPEPLVLMDVRYGVAFRVSPAPKAVDEVRFRLADLALRHRLLECIASAWAEEGRGARPLRSVPRETFSRTS